MISRNSHEPANAEALFRMTPSTVVLVVFPSGLPMQRTVQSCGKHDFT